jgi:carboxymethylenebutenolidase
MQHDDLRKDFDALVPGRTTDAGASRRTALRVALGAGFGVGYAAATLPVAAQTAVQTPADGLVAGKVEIDVGGFKLPAFRAAPEGKTGLPVVLVIQEIFGVHEYIADVCRRFARAGYLAIAPELFVRQGDPSQIAEVSKLMSEIVSKVPDAQVMGDLDATVKWAGAHGGDLARVASPASVGAGASPGSTPRTARSRPAWPGTGGWWGRRATSRRSTPWTSPRSSRHRCSASTAKKTAASPLTRLIR